MLDMIPDKNASFPLGEMFGMMREIKTANKTKEPRSKFILDIRINCIINMTIKIPKMLPDSITKTLLISINFLYLIDIGTVRVREAIIVGIGTIV